MATYTFMTPIRFSYVEGVRCWLTEMGEEGKCEHYSIAYSGWEGMQQRTHLSKHACPVLQGYHHMHTGGYTQFSVAINKWWPAVVELQNIGKLCKEIRIT